MSPTPKIVGTVLSVGGLDSSGSAGVLVDAAACGAVDVHAACVLALTTIQSSDRFVRARPAPPEEIRESMGVVLDALAVGAVKTGALGGADQVAAVAEVVSRPGFPPLVVDPVMLSTSGGVLLDEKGVDALVERLFPLASLVTPNMAEAGALIGREVNDVSSMRRAARRIVEMGPSAVLVKGGHLDGDRVEDLLILRDGGEHRFAPHARVGQGARGTGCALASLIAALLVKGNDLPEAVSEARQVLRRAIAGAVPVGDGPPVLRFEKVR